MSNDLLDAARFYVSRGWSVIPVSATTKRPTLDTWKVYQTRLPTADEMAEWWGPATGIAVLTGEISHLVVLDWDQRHHEGEAPPVWGEGPTVHTQSGGRHYYFRYDGPVRNAQGVRGYDVRGDGGYVVAPPTPGYAVLGPWADPDDLPSPPAWVHPTPRATWKEALGQVEDGRQDDHLIALAGKLHRSLPEDLWPVIPAGLAEVARHYPQRAGDPWTAKDFERISASAARMETSRRAGADVIWAPASVADRARSVLPPHRWLVPGLIVEGRICLMLGKPKKGKSILSTMMGLHVAGERWMWGPQTHVAEMTRHAGVPPQEGGEVLHVAMEEEVDDVVSRIQANLGGPLKGNRYFVVGTDAMPVTLLMDKLDAWMAAHPKCVLIIIDPFVKVLPGEHQGNPYRAEYEMVGHFRRFVRRHRVAFLINHHARKADGEELTDVSLSTSGLPGAVDHTILIRRERQEEIARLTSEGRYGGGIDTMMRFDCDRLLWVRIEGQVVEVREQLAEEPVLAFAREHASGFKTMDLAKALGIPERTARRRIVRTDALVLETIPGTENERRWVTKPGT